ncbi:tetratricopeptide repeat protein [Motiliproteus sp. SC1-56]|uniref:tetratricopeptide repeat protein n=1 Tax=Motiliproteus sp. SC1-56 TaxID=2799565 RepID=UPI001F5E2C5C|nr:tetratricopeptide repeat protein [Motiliproteus sp. SC1-56]
MLQSDPERALELIKAAADAPPESASVQYHFATALAKQGHSEQAIEVLTALEGTQFSERKEAEQLARRLRH